MARRGLSSPSDAVTVLDRTLRGSFPGTRAARRSSAPHVLVSSAAQLLAKHGSSPAEEHQDCGEKGDQSLSLSIPSGHDIVDSFGAISLESLNFPVGPEEPQGALLVPRPCPSAGGNSPIPSGAALETPKKEELNIEERIPVYLRNLGIEQSPGTILAPFVPRGPLRELEFSPWGLRSLQPPLDTAPLDRVPPQAQGALLPAFEMSQASFGSDVSPLSVSLSVGSAAGSEQDQDLLSPRELSASSPTLSGDSPASQGSVPGPQLEGGGTEGSPGRAGAEQDLPSCSSGRGPQAGGRRAQGALADPECRSSDSSQQGWAPGALSGLGNDMGLDRASSSSGVGSESSQGQEREPLMGPGALQELRELLAQAEALAASWSRPAGPTASCREQGEREEGPKGARLGQDWIPELQETLSWDEAVTPRGVRAQELGMHPLHSASCQLAWGHPLAVSSQHRERPRAGKSAGRWEPEGSSSVGRSQAAPWVKMKLASQSQECGADWDEEPQLRMEGIKAELLPKTREPAPAKDPWLCGLEAASEYLRKQGQELEGVQAPRCPRDRHGQLSRTWELLQPSSPPAAPCPRADPWHYSLLKDMQLKPWGAAELQDVQLKPWGAAELQDVQLKPWGAAELQDVQLKPCITAEPQEMQLKSWNTADLQDVQLKPWNTADLQEMHLKPCSAAEPQEMQLKPCSAAEPQDVHLKPWNPADLQEMHLKPCSTAEPQDVHLKPWNPADLQEMHLKPCRDAPEALQCC
ncbi:uncharacterized protein LOC115948857 [Geospiza fortis]|uniref:Uncharacterized protein LOC115948857 n=1 Tax=Geospiza fortis TaxID=48883 RepID=A0A8N5F1X6_GEOFO|nr:uncharacterized protein LOC115948857 [Geospiza fortis]